MSLLPAVKVADLPEVGAVKVELEGRAVAVVRAEDGSIHAIDDICSHANVSLSEGEVEDCTVECWLHGSQFDLRSGQPLSLPATTPIDVFTVTVDDGTVFVDVAAPTNAPRKES